MLAYAIENFFFPLPSSFAGSGRFISRRRGHTSARVMALWITRNYYRSSTNHLPLAAAWLWKFTQLTVTRHLLGLYANRMRVVRIVEHDSNKGCKTTLQFTTHLKGSSREAETEVCHRLSHFWLAIAEPRGPSLGRGGKAFQYRGYDRGFQAVPFKRILTRWVPRQRFPR
jgi:hypothetical protein